MKRIGHWIIDYVYLLRGGTHSFIYHRPPKHYLGHIVEGKYPIILIPGLMGKWNNLAKIANRISLLGHPVYIVPKLGMNTADIPTSSKIVREVIDQNNLDNTLLLAYSKGGLIGKYLLAHFNKDKRVKKLISIATPYHGVGPVKYIPIKHYKELATSSEIITDLSQHNEVNDKIVSIYPIFDNHIWPQSSAHLEGATNIRVDVSGHHKVLYSKEVEKKILEQVE
ncbi:hypothetical protein HYT59_00565 [Candidatus Woesebacteria bacterium]|nr:hypothetical protein [Candidatus Woesebacteria bacterium]